MRIMCILYLYLPCQTKKYTYMESNFFVNLSSDYAGQLCYYLRETAAKKMLSGEYVPDGVYYLLGLLTIENEKRFLASEDENSKESV